MWLKLRRKLFSKIHILFKIAVFCWWWLWSFTFEKPCIENVVKFFNTFEVKVQENYCNILKAMLETLRVSTVRYFLFKMLLSNIFE